MVRTKEAKPIKGPSNPEQWFLEQLRAYTQRQPRTERTPECPDDSFLRAYAARPGSFPLSDPRVRHVTSCDHCLPALLDIRSGQAEVRRFPGRPAVVAMICAACLIIGVVGGTYWTRHRGLVGSAPSSQASAIPVRQTLDLFDYGTYRGSDGPPPRPPLNLPPALLQAHIILPRFSEAGAYMISIAGDRTGKGRLACVSGVASQSGNKTSIDVIFDLRAARPGDYFLLTQLSGQDDSYSYPVKVE